MPSPIRQSSFAGGEVAPQFYGKTKDPRYGISLRTCKNFLPIVDGALVNRSGTYFQGLAKSSTVRFKEFIFSDAQALVLEFTNLTIRFWASSGQVLNAGVPYEVVTPYVAADLQRLKLEQAGDIITITHPSYQARELARISNTNWTLTAVSTSGTADFGGATELSNPFPAGGLSPPTQWNAGTIYAKAALVNRNNIGYISLQAANTGNDPASARTWWSPQSWDSNVAYKTGDMVWHTTGYDGTAPSLPATSNGQIYLSLQSTNQGNRPDTAVAYWVAAVDATHPAKDWSLVRTITWSDVNGIRRETLACTPFSIRVPVYTDRALTLFWPADQLVAFTHVTEQYNWYAGRNGLYGLIGSAPANGGNGGTFSWDGKEPDYTVSPPAGTNPFAIAPAGTSSYPAVVTWHEQRRLFGASDKRPQDIWGCDLRDSARFDRPTDDRPILLSEVLAYNWKIAARRLEHIRSMVSFGLLCLFTGQGEWTVQGRDGAGITAVSPPQIRRHSAHGSSYLDPLEHEHALLFNTAKGNQVRSWFFDYNSNAFVSRNISRIARHLLRNKTIVAWARQEQPYAVDWIVLSDGALISVTYDHDSQVVAWAQHPMDGTVLAVACIPDGTEDALWLCVLRNGAPCVEKMATRDNITDQRKACFLDAALAFDGRNTDAASTVQVSGASYNANDDVTITSSAGTYAPADVGDEIVIDPDGTPTRITITGYTSPTILSGRLVQPLPLAFQNVATASWGFARDSFSGLGHLEGKTVNALADGVVQGPFVVTGGIVAPLNPPALMVTIGLPYNSDAELLDVAHDAIKPNVKAVTQVTVEVVDSRSFSAGRTFDDLHPAKLKEVDDNFGVPALVTDQIEIRVKGGWDKNGRVCIRQSDPLPLTIAAVIREVEAGGSGG